MGKQKNLNELTKRQKEEILKAYTISKAEYKEKRENFFINSGLHSGIIFSDIETEPGYFEVRRTDANGNTKFRDRWKKEKDGSMTFISSNPIEVPLSDIEIIKDLQEENEKLKEAGRELKKQLANPGASIVSENDLLELYELREENEKLKKELSDIREKLTRRGRAGRPEDTEKKELLHDKITKLMESGKTEKEICKELEISRATYFRYKKSQ